MFRLTRPVSPPGESTSMEEEETTLSEISNCRQQAALTRSSRQLSRHHQEVVLPPRLDEQPIHQQIRRCCERMQSYPKAVDTLYRAVSAILNQPNERKFRRIDTASPGYQRTLANVPGAEQLLRTLGFTGTNNAVMLMLKSLRLENFDLALEMLEQTKSSVEYKTAKRQQEFVQQVRELLKRDPSHEELLKRKKLLSLVPREPGPGRAAVMIIQLLPSNQSEGLVDGTVLSRRFDGDDTLQDVLHWLGGTAGTEFYHKIVHSQEYCLVDVNRNGPAVDCRADSNKTLQHMGFWPTGRLLLQLTLPTKATRETPGHPS